MTGSSKSNRFSSSWSGRLEGFSALDSTNLVSSPRTNASSRVVTPAVENPGSTSAILRSASGKAEVIYQVRILHHRGRNLFQRTRNAFCRESQRAKLLLTEKMWPKRHTDGTFAVEQSVFAHGVAQFLERPRS